MNLSIESAVNDKPLTLEEMRLISSAANKMLMNIRTYHNLLNLKVYCELSSQPFGEDNQQLFNELDKLISVYDILPVRAEPEYVSDEHKNDHGVISAITKSVKWTLTITDEEEFLKAIKLGVI